MGKVWITLGCLTLLNSCAIMSKDECLNANWELLGQRDGVAGAGSLAQQRGKVCAKYKVSLDRSLYADGYRKGVKTYCNPQAVFEYALHGQGDYQSCPLEMHNELRPYYHAAKNYYDAKANMEAIEYKIAKAKGRLSEVKSREMSDYYRGIIIENSELLSQAGRNLNQEEIKLKQFKKDNF